MQFHRKQVCSRQSVNIILESFFELLNRQNIGFSTTCNIVNVIVPLNWRYLWFIQPGHLYLVWLILPRTYLKIFEEMPFHLAWTTHLLLFCTSSAFLSESVQRRRQVCATQNVFQDLLPLLIVHQDNHWFNPTHFIDTDLYAFRISKQTLCWAFHSTSHIWPNNCAMRAPGSLTSVPSWRSIRNLICVLPERWFPCILRPYYCYF